MKQYRVTRSIMAGLLCSPSRMGDCRSRGEGVRRQGRALRAGTRMHDAQPETVNPGVSQSSAQCRSTAF